jgi:hypothetical protein
MTTTPTHDSSSSSSSSGSDVRNVSTYQMPILASYNGNLVRLIATGDIPGKSPVCQYIDNDGKMGWDSLKSFTVVDSHFLPPNQEVLRDSFSKLRSLTTTR